MSEIKFTKTNVLLNLVGSAVVIAGGILYSRWDTRRYAKMTQEVHDRTEEQIDKTAKLFEQIEKDRPEF